MRPARVLIVDDSVVIRRSLAEALSREPEVSVAEGAANGKIALTKMQAFRPDLVVLDLEIPESDTLATLAALRAAHPQTVVIMLGHATDREGAIALDALALGASDYVTKPDVGAITEQSLTILSRELAANIRRYCYRVEHRASTRPQSHRAPAAATTSSSPATNRRVDIVVIGVSTGGPSALMDLIPRLPENFPVPILIVQHMPPMFTRLLADRLNTRSKIHVVEAGESELLRPGVAWISPGDFHLCVVRDGDKVRLRTHQAAPEHSCRPSVDVLFRSVAQAYGPHVLALVMTGMGSDGFSGCKEIRAAGGQVIVQDEASSVVWGMPGVVVRANMADDVVPLDALSAQIVGRVSAFRDRTAPTIPISVR